MDGTDTTAKRNIRNADAGTITSRDNAILSVGGIPLHDSGNHEHNGAVDVEQGGNHDNGLIVTAALPTTTDPCKHPRINLREDEIRLRQSQELSWIVYGGLGLVGTVIVTMLGLVLLFLLNRSDNTDESMMVMDANGMV